MFALNESIQIEANKSALRRRDQVHEQVDWDQNMRPLSDRLKPFHFILFNNYHNHTITNNTYNIGIDSSEDSNEKIYLEIKQRAQSTSEPGCPSSGTGSAVWTAGIGLSRFLEWKYRGLDGLKGKNCLELGCGTGLTSLVAAYLGGNVTATDIPLCVTEDAAPNIEANMRILNTYGNSGSIIAKELIWGQTSLDSFQAIKWDFILASDVIYRAEHVPLLIATLKELTTEFTSVYVAFDRRGREGLEAFIQLIKDPQQGFTLREVSAEEMPVGFRFLHLGIVELHTNHTIKSTVS